jgi:hypothetical protein
MQATQSLGGREERTQDDEIQFVAEANLTPRNPGVFNRFGDGSRPSRWNPIGKCFVN